MFSVPKCVVHCGMTLTYLNRPGPHADLHNHPLRYWKTHPSFVMKSHVLCYLAAKSKDRGVCPGVGGLDGYPYRKGYRCASRSW